MMADKNLQFLDIPRHDPEKLPVDVRVTQFREYRLVEENGVRSACYRDQCAAIGLELCSGKFCNGLMAADGGKP